MFAARNMMFAGRQFESNLLYAAKDSNTLLHRKGNWGSGVGGFMNLVDNGFSLSSTYSFAITLKRLSANLTYGIPLAVLAGGAQNDNFAFGVQGNVPGNTSMLNLYRFNDYSTWFQTNIPISNTVKFVGIHSSTSGTMWYGKTTSNTKNLNRPNDSRLTLRALFLSDYEITNVAWWNRALTTAEKDAYYDGTLPLFN